MRAGNGWGSGIAGCVVLAFVTAIAHAETCGIDSIFANGFDIPVPGSVDNTPGALQSPGIATSITGPVSISVTYPPNGSTVNGTSTDVAGTLTGPIDTGIVVNGVVAVVDGSSFLASVPLQSGSNPINVVATTLTGSTASASITLTQGSASPPPISLSVSRASAFAPFLVTFTPTIGTLPGGGSVTSLSIDYNGDGINDVTNPAAGVPLTYLANTPNLYAARLTVVDSNHNTYTAYTRYMAQSFPHQSGMMCDVYAYMKQRLGAQDTGGALSTLDANTRPEFQDLFTNNATTLPAYVANLGSIVDGYVSGRSATFMVVRQNPDSTLSGYHMEYTQGADGTWRISGM